LDHEPPSSDHIKLTKELDAWRIKVRSFISHDIQFRDLSYILTDIISTAPTKFARYASLIMEEATRPLLAGMDRMRDLLPIPCSTWTKQDIALINDDTDIVYRAMTHSCIQWVTLLTAVVNYNYGNRRQPDNCLPFAGPLSEVQTLCIHRFACNAAIMLVRQVGLIPHRDWSQELKSKKINEKGTKSIVLIG
jgi:hypothetical protein